MAVGTKDKTDLSQEEVDQKIAGMEDQFSSPSQEEGQEDESNKQKDKGKSPNAKDIHDKAKDTKKKVDQAKEAVKGGEQVAKHEAEAAGKTVVKQGATRGAEAALAGGEAAASSTGVGAVGVGAVEVGKKEIKTGYVVGKAFVTADTKDLGKELNNDKKWLIVILLILLALIFFIGLPIFLFVGLLTMYNAEQQANQTVPLTLTKTGPTQAKAGDTLVYTITVGYPAAYQEISVTDQIPAGTIYVGSNQKVTCDNGACNAASKAVTWKATANNVVAPVTATYTVTLRATVDNKYIVNVANGTAVASIGGAAPGGDPNSNDFYKLMVGQGRNTAVLGDENNFIKTVLANSKGKFNVAGKEAELRQLYKAAITNNVNPLILFAMWGVESGWSTANKAVFGCGVTSGTGGGFATQLACVVQNKRPGLNGLMTEFTNAQAKAGGKPILHPDARYRANCPAFTDPFIYAYELYTPVCAINDGNSNARANFVKYYKGALGAGAQ